MLVPLIISDEKLIRLIDESLQGNKIVGVFTQIDRNTNIPGPLDLYYTGCAMQIQKMASFPDGHIRIIGQGLSRIEIINFTDDIPFMRARIRVIEEETEVDQKVKAIMVNVSNAFFRLMDHSESYPEDLRNVIPGIKDPGRLGDLLAANIDMDIGEKQKALELSDSAARLEYIFEKINREVEIARIGEKIRADVNIEMDREQREYYLRQQIRVIQKELGDADLAVELDELKDQIDGKAMPDHAREASIKEWNRICRMNSSSSEYSVSRRYLEWLIEIPWEESTDDHIDIKQAKSVLDRDHYDLDEPKERILEFLAVRKLKKGAKGSIICFTGPPGVGKTSLGMSIASATGRNFVRMSLGGVKDEAEIRGHRRTYIGAMPGRIIQGLNTAGCNNPVFMLDEIDKLGSDFRGDPSSALLEVLDPEQNRSFVDNYLNISFDLSKVLFITTANLLETIPPALMDRMEVIEIPGYITNEKIEIAKRFLLPGQFEENGIKEGKLEITDDAIRDIIERYTREAGVRELQRKIGNIARKVARKLVEGKRGPYKVSPRNLKNYLGGKDYAGQDSLPAAEVGVSTGMAKTATGGVILFIEALAMNGDGKVKLTGQLGDVMKESAEAALSFVRSFCWEEMKDEKFFERHDIHLHIPSGAVPKDGPSAGVAIATALASLATGLKVRNDIAMTGEITLTGKVLAVGGIKDKVIAAHRAGIKRIILPSSNRKDLEDIPEKIRNDISFDLIDRLTEGIAIAIGQQPRNLSKQKGAR
ncbi:MAG: endopeptidase La [Candidatus Krumholzibacteriota bacterium]|nr:endopeptidase La [Candidatus Krumholzibacteriota bacterium]